MSFIVGLGETILTLSQTILTSLGVPFALILLLIVEHQRVLHGIELFEVDHSLASFAAAGLVVINLVLEFLAHHIEHQAGYVADRENHWSLRIWWQNARYTLGRGETWTPRPLSPAARYKRLLRLVTFTILALALAGSMRSVIEATPGTWVEALMTIITDSDLLTIATWAGGLLFATAAVLSAQGLCRYVAIRCVEIFARMHERVETTVQASAAPYLSDVERAGAVTAYALIAEKVEKAKTKRQPAQEQPVATDPVLEIDPVSLNVRNIAAAAGMGDYHQSNGNGHHTTS